MSGLDRPSIIVRSLGKKYSLGERSRPHPRLSEVIGDYVRAARNYRSHRRKSVDFWALRDVSFSVARGEAVGVIGSNGAGKSTLLKVLSRITTPTHGTAIVRGRVGSLLEVGTGFHPDLTGRENVFLNGAILGMTRRETSRQFDAIVDFAEVERFLDTPVKRYSSGMYLRLAFAVAAHLDSDILLVDEVLAVGDAAFQKKCLGTMNDVRSRGKTVVFVSHSMPAIQTLCSRAMYLSEGRVIADGPPADIVRQYAMSTEAPIPMREWPDAHSAPGNLLFRLKRASVVAKGGYLTTRTPFVIEFEYWNLKPGAILNLSLHIYNDSGTLLFNALPVIETTWQGKPFPVGLFRDSCAIPADLLRDGVYRVELLVVHDGRAVFQLHDALLFEINDDPELRQGWFGEWPGVIRPIFDWSTEYLGPTQITAESAASNPHLSPFEE